MAVPARIIGASVSPHSEHIPPRKVHYANQLSVIGSIGAVITFFASSINLITYCPPEMAGVAGAWTQVLAQVGGAVTLGVQAGLQTDNLADWTHSSARAFWFMIAWVAVLAGQYVIFYRQPDSQEREHEMARERIRKANVDFGV